MADAKIRVYLNDGTMPFECPETNLHNVRRLFERKIDRIEYIEDFPAVRTPATPQRLQINKEAEMQAAFERSLTKLKEQQSEELKKLQEKFEKDRAELQRTLITAQSEKEALSCKLKEKAEEPAKRGRPAVTIKRKTN